MGKVPLHVYEKAKMKKKVGDVIGMVIVGAIALTSAVSILGLLWIFLFGLWASGLGWASVAVFALIVGLPLGIWLSNSGEKVLEQVEREGVVDE